MRNVKAIKSALIVIGISAISACSQGISKEDIRHAHDMMYNKGNIDIIDEMYAADYVRHSVGHPDSLYVSGS